ncbi:MAG: hypothetical protein EAZ79_05895, partial [Oscillatoriales cyanobacterium]
KSSAELEFVTSADNYSKSSAELEFVTSADNYSNSPCSRTNQSRTDTDTGTRSGALQQRASQHKSFIFCQLATAKPDI